MHYSFIACINEFRWKYKDAYNLYMVYLRPK